MVYFQPGALENEAKAKLINHKVQYAHLKINRNSMRVKQIGNGELLILNQ